MLITALADLEQRYPEETAAASSSSSSAPPLSKRPRKEASIDLDPKSFDSSKILAIPGETGIGIKIERILAQKSAKLTARIARDTLVSVGQPVPALVQATLNEP